MENSSSNFIIVLDCNLSLNTYSAEFPLCHNIPFAEANDGELPPFHAPFAVTGRYDDMISNIASTALLQYEDFINTCFDRKTIISDFHENPKHNFINIFYKYKTIGSDTHEHCCALIAFISQNDAGEVTLKLYLRNVKGIRSSYENSFVNAFSPEHFKKVSVIHDNLRLALIFDVSKNSYEVVGGSLAGDEHIGLPLHGDIRQFFKLLESAESDSQEQQFKISKNLTEEISNSLVFHGNYSFRRIPVKGAISTRWHELSFISLNLENTSVLITLKDIHDTLAEKLTDVSDEVDSATAEEIAFSAISSMEAIVESVMLPCCCIKLKDDLPVITANHAFYELSGYLPDEFKAATGNNLIYSCHPSDIPYARKLAIDALKTGQQELKMELRVITAGGEIRWMRISAQNRNTLLYPMACLIFEDITDSKFSRGNNSSEARSGTYSKKLNILFDYDFKTDTLKDRGGLSDFLGFPSNISKFSQLLRSESFVHPDDRDELDRITNQIQVCTESINGHLRICVPKYNSAYADVLFTLSSIFDAAGMPHQIIGVIEKITLDKKINTDAGKEISNLNLDGIATQTFHTTDMGIGLRRNALNHFMLNLSDGIVESCSTVDFAGFTIPDSTGAPIDKAMAEIADSLFDGETKKAFLEAFNLEALLANFEEGDMDTAGVFGIAQKSPSPLWLKVFTHLFLDEKDKCIKALIYSCDVSEEYRQISTLVHASSKDPLTGLLNRARAKELITSHLDEMGKNEISAFLIIDLDNFKEINDIYDHQTGDEYLMQFADALMDFLPDAIVARLGGDEFIVFIRNCGSVSQVSNTALSILKLIKDINLSRITTFNTTGSIGIAMAPYNGQDFETLYHNADQALYEVKRNSKDGFLFCDDENSEISHRINHRHRDFFFRRLWNFLSATGVLVTILIICIMATVGITAGVYANVQRTAYRQADENLATHGEYLVKCANTYINGRLDDTSSISIFAGLHFGEDTFASEMDAYLAQFDFRQVLIVSNKGFSEYYRYGSLHFSGDETFLGQSLLFSNSALSDTIYNYDVERGTLVIARPIFSNEENVACLICYLSAKSVSQYLETIATYPEERIFLADEAGTIIADSVYNTAMLNFLDAPSYLQYNGFGILPSKFSYSIFHDRISSPSVNRNGEKFVLTYNYFLCAGVENTQIFTVYAILPQASLIGSLSSSMRLLIALMGLSAFAGLTALALLLRGGLKSEKYMSTLAYKDSLTSLNNMEYIIDNAKPLMKICGEPCAVVSLNVDNFRIIRDAYGTAKSNKLITCIGNSIADFVEDTETAARYIDDKYCLILTYLGESPLSDRLKDLRSYIFSNVATYMAAPINFTISMGVYVAETADESIRHAYEMAELARSYLKDRGKDSIYFYNASLQQSIQKQKLMEDSLDQALEDGEFAAYFQPIVSLKSHKVVAAEALTRWIRPDGTVIPPEDFIPLLEKHGTIVTLDYYIFERVCAQMQLWRDTPLGNLAISVNMSRQHFYQPDFIERLTRTTAKYGIPNSRVHIEITESLYVSDDRLIDRVLQELRETGFLISMDDFGTGYSSLSMLQKIPIDILKIDKQLLDSSFASESGMIVLEGLLDIAKKLNLSTICEGVDTVKELSWLKNAGCDMAQGFYYARPLPPVELENFMLEYQNRLRAADKEQRK